MRIGIPRETRDGERRVGAAPVGVAALVADGHDVLLQAGAGAAVGHLCAPTYVECGVVHYAVPTMPSLVARTATLALTAATLPYVRRLAAGIDRALAADPGLAAGLMVRDGRIVHAGLAADAARRPAAALAEPAREASR